jgi:hypothetical protein
MSNLPISQMTVVPLENLDPNSKIPIAQAGNKATTPEILRQLTVAGLHSCGGAVIGGYRNVVESAVSGTLTSAAHSGKYLITAGNVVIPNGADDVGAMFILRAGGAHTVTFNGGTSPAMAAGDLMTVFVESTTAVQAVLTAAADKVAFS